MIKACRYQIFAGYDYYPSGGWSDHHGGCDSITQAVDAAIATDAEWWHIADLMTGKIVTCSDCRKGFHNEQEHHK